MRRIVVLGNSGSGKSTLARRLGGRLNLPVVHLDVLFWSPGWTEPEDNEVFRAKVREAIAGDAWICEGNFVGRTFDLRLPRADAVIFIDQPRWLCLVRILWRWLTNFGRTRADLAEGCPETFDWPFFLWTWNFRRQSQPRILEEAARYPTPITHLRGDAAMARFLAKAVQRTAWFDG
jgi:adenylate kinase family enzyme